MIPPRTKSLICHQVQKYVLHLKSFKTSNPVIMLGQLKLDRIDHKLLKQSFKLNHRQYSKITNTKLQQGNKKYQKRKAAITYRSYTVEFKRKLIQNIKQIDCKSNIGLSKIVRIKAKQLNIHPKNIFRWFHTKEIKKKQGGRKALYPQMQQRLAQFIINNPKMKRKHILRQAKKIMEELNIPGRQYFNFSKGWYERFRQRLIRKKIIPGYIRNIKTNQQDDSDSDFDDSQYSILKKQENNQNNLKKQQYVDTVKQQQCLYDVIVKQEYNHQEYYDSQDDQQRNQPYSNQQVKKYLKDEEHLKEDTKMILDNYVLFYDQIIKVDSDDEENVKTQKVQGNIVKNEIKEEYSQDMNKVK